MSKQFIRLIFFFFFLEFVSIAQTDLIDECFINFENATTLKASDAERLPEKAPKSRKVSISDSKDAKISRIDGYRKIYKNVNKTEFVNIKVELSSPKKYADDQKYLLANMEYIRSISSAMQADGIIELEFNGYKFYGLSRFGDDAGETIGIFMMFPGNNISVHFYFKNIDKEHRHYQNVDEYRVLRDKFMEEYAAHLAECLNN